MGVHGLAERANVIRRRATAAAEKKDAAVEQCSNVCGHILGRLRIGRAVLAIQLGHAGVGIGHDALVLFAPLQGLLDLLAPAEGIRHPRVLAAPSFRAAVEPDNMRMVEAADQRSIPMADLFIDPLIFPVSVDGAYGQHALGAIEQLRARLGSEVHITGGFSNVSFGLPCRQLINDVFLLLAVEAGADSAILDPTASSIVDVFSNDRSAAPYALAEDVLMGRDEYCTRFIRAYRKGELTP